VHPPEPSPEVDSHTFVQMAAWIELFYDLVFVAAILVFSSAVAHLHDADRISWVVGVFCAVWWVWFSTTLFANRFRREDVGHRLLILFQMFLVAVIAMEARAGVAHDAAYLALTYGLLLGTVAAMYWRVSRSDDEHAAFARHLAGLNAIAALCFIVAAPLPDPLRIALSVVGLVVVVLPALVRSSRLGDYPPLNEHHLTERMGAFTIIVCGESFVKVAIAVSDNTITDVDVVALAFQFVLTFALWACYFEDIPHAGINERRLAPWVGLHLLVQVCIAGTAIGVSKLVNIGLLSELPAEDILEIMATLSVLYLGLAGLGACTRRRPIAPLVVLRVATAVVVALVGVAAWRIDWIDLIEGVALLTVVAVAHAFLVAWVRGTTTVMAPDRLGLRKLARE
jgi:low temperature requirement protein LtrA